MIFIQNKTLFSLIFLLILISITYQIEIPLKLVKTKFQKNISSKVSIDYKSSQINTIYNYLFGADITIGSNKQPFTVIIDTGSEILWVGGEEASTKNRYIPSNSKTSKRTTEVLNYEYSSGTIKGYFYDDQINFLISNSFYAHFGVSSATSILDSYFDGILGLARRYSSTKYSILHTIRNNGAVSSTKFSFKYDYNTDNLYFYLDEIHNDFKNSNSNLASCSLINSEHYGNSLWLCDVVSFGIKQGDTIVKSVSLKTEGLFDTGTNNIIVPSKYISDFQSTLSSMNCFLYEEGNTDFSEKAIYCRNENDLPKITIGVRGYTLTIGKKNFYNKLNVNNEIVYRLRFLFANDIDLILIGQTFFYEYHTLFDDDNGVLKFYNDDTTKIVHNEDNSGGTSTVVIVLLIVGGVIVIGGIITGIIIYIRCKRNKNNDGMLIDKEKLEMASIKRGEDMDDDDNNETTFNQIMSIKSDKKVKAINININYKK